MEKIYILTHTTPDGQYTPQVFATRQEARNVLVATYVGLRTNEDAIYSEKLEDDYAEIVYNDDTYDSLNIYEVDAPEQPVLTKQKSKLDECWEFLEKCRTLAEMEETINTFPIGTGEWDIEVIGDNTVEVTNYFDNGDEYEEDSDIFYNIIIHADQSYYDEFDRQLP